MKNNILSIPRRIVLPGILIMALLTPGALYAQADSARYHLWLDDAQFAKLSSAAQNLLIAKFGPKLRRDGKGNLIAPGGSTGSGTGAGFGTGPAGQIVKGSGLFGAMTAIPNNLVNNAAADATAQDTQSETTIVLGSGSNIISGFNDSGSHVGGVNKFTGFSTSASAGSSWTDGGTLPNDTSGDAGDPVLSRNATTGRVYFSTLAFSGTGLQMFRSDNNGGTWMPPVNCAPGMTGQQDKDWNTVDNFGGSGNGNVYVVWRAFSSGATDGIRFTRSTDNGNTFGPSTGLLIAGPGAYNVQGANVVVGTDHSVYVFWLDQSAGSGTPNIVKLAKSTDQGLSFGAATTVGTLIGTGVNGDLLLPAGFRSNSFAQAAVNPASGNLYIVYNDVTAAGDHGNIYLRQSTNGGSAWSAATQVNTDSTTRSQYMPALAVKPDGSGLSVTWYDNRDDPADRNLARWGATAAISGSTLTFGPNFRISPVYPPVFGVDPVVNSTYMGDYDQMTADNSLYYTTWGDNRDNSIAGPSRKNANVRFASYAQAGPGAILDFSSALVSGGNGNGQIDSNECNQLAVTVKDNGGAAATGVTGTLSTSTPGVLISNATQAYPDLNPGSKGSNSAPFQVVTTSVPCGTPINFTLSMSYAGGSDVINFTISAGGSGYAISSSTGTIVPGTTDIGNHCDDCVTAVSLPFPVKLYNSTFTTVNLGSNGNAQFSSTSTEYSNVCLPVGTFNNAIFAHWDDLMTSIRPGDGIFTSVSGVSPGRIFNIEWRSTHYPGTGSAHFELRLHENSSQFEVVYDTITGGGNSATVGAQMATGASFSQYACNTIGSISQGLMLTFALPPCLDGGGPCNPCTLTCPGNINVSNDPGRCGAVVNYPAPTTSGGCGAVTCVPPSGSFFSVGTTQVNCSSASGQSCSFSVTVADTQQPGCSITVSPAVLTPNNHKLVNVSVKVVSTDNCPVTCALTSITSSEADSGLAKNDIPKDIQGASYGTCDTLVQLRAERFSTTSDRIYTLTYTVTDGSGRTSTCSGTVRVPLSKKGVSAFGPSAEANPVPGETFLGQNHPNPFNPTTEIVFALSVPSIVSLRVFNVLGQEVALLLNRQSLDEGYQSVGFDAGSLPSGVYFYRLQAIPLSDGAGGHAGGIVQTKRMILMR